MKSPGGLNKKRQVPQEDRPIRILVVEDDAFARLACAEYLLSMGFDVVSASTGEKALRRAEQHHPHIVICDWQLGEGMDGVEVARRIRSDYDATVLMMSGQPLSLLKASVEELPVHAYFRKPISLQALNDAILSIEL